MFNSSTAGREVCRLDFAKGFRIKLNTGNISKESPLKGKASNCLKNQPLGTMPLKIKSFSKDKFQFQIPFWKRIKQTGYLDENGW